MGKDMPEQRRFTWAREDVCMGKDMPEQGRRFTWVWGPAGGRMALNSQTDITSLLPCTLGPATFPTAKEYLCEFLCKMLM